MATPRFGVKDATVLDTQKGYDRWAEIYDDEHNPLIAVEALHIDALIGNVAGRTIVDVGCGTGRQTRRLLEAGASVVAIDFSTRMLARARAGVTDSRVRFVEHDITRGLPLEDASVDGAICSLVLEHLPDLEGAIAELARVCRQGSRITLSDLHPAMFDLGIQARFTDPITGNKTVMQSFQRPVAAYVEGAHAAGLRIRHLSEELIDERVIAHLPAARKYAGCKMLLLLSLER